MAGAEGGDTGLDDPVAALRAERASTYRSLERARALALSRLGRHAEAADELAQAGPRASAGRGGAGRAAALRGGDAGTVGGAGPLRGLSPLAARRARQRPGPALQPVHQQLLQGTSPAVRHGVAYEPNPLLGRDDDIAAVADLLRSVRVTSIVGPAASARPVSPRW